MARAFVFPGQGSQAVGMGQELAEAFPVAAHLFEEINDALGQDLRKLMFEGPDDELMLTENAQPALMSVSMAALRVLEKEGGIAVGKDCDLVAGHSLGEYSALCAAGSLSVEHAAQLLKTRGRAMQKAVPVGEGAMAALLGIGLDVAKDVAAEATADGETCEVANDNDPNQVVVSGAKAAVERAIEIAKEKGAKRGVLLPVSAPFHCTLMQPAADVMQEALAAIVISPPAVPVVANVTAEPVSDPDMIRGLLVEQVTATVRWRESVMRMHKEGVSELVELGAGKVLAGLARRIEPEMTGVSVGKPADVEAFLGSV